MSELKDKTVFITGASSGIGEACAKRFAASGARLLLCARRLERLTSLKEHLQQEFDCEVHVFRLDVSVREEVLSSLEKLPPEWKNIDVLVNNAGLAAGRDLMVEANLEDWDQMIDVNLKGLLYVTRAILPNMVQRNAGCIVNIASTAGHVVYPGGSVYSATKHAVRAVSKTLSLEVMPTNIRVCSVDPGLVETEFSVVRFGGNKGAADEVYQGVTPLTGEDVADAVYYAASRPAHVQISEIVMLATAQGDGKTVHRE